MSWELKAQVAEFVLRTATLIDRDDLEGFVECFDDDSRYIVLPRENQEKGYEIGLMRCDSKAILRDRITVLRHASKFNPHWDRHVLSGTLVTEITDRRVRASTAFMVVQTTLNGVSELYCSGTYEDRIAVDGTMRLLERIVSLDTFTVNNCMATPV